MKENVFADSRGAATKLFQDVGSNNVKVYDVLDYQGKVEIPVHQAALLSKWTHVSVAVSGDATTGKEWMVVAPYRVDSSKQTNDKCYDIDPVLFVLDSDTGTSHASGVVAYHQEYPGRTTLVPGYEQVTVEHTVQFLRSKLITGMQPLDQAPPEVLESLQHMVQEFGFVF
jgi:hypothetical protein